jgi:hypothetical protein
MVKAFNRKNVIRFIFLLWLNCYYHCHNNECATIFLQASFVEPQGFLQGLEINGSACFSWFSGSSVALPFPELSLTSPFAGKISITRTWSSRHPGKFHFKGQCHGNRDHSCTLYVEFQRRGRSFSILRSSRF